MRTWVAASIIITPVLVLAFLAVGCRGKDKPPFIPPPVEVIDIKPKPMKRRKPAPVKVMEPSFGDPDSRYGDGKHGEAKLK
jgi:hypothetical protein